ncbi:MAG: GyrI-like domain-containing protein [Bacteroidetes bacterium]|nr:GyrI-like domain-containing protein [Bacteroidota bacterium]
MKKILYVIIGISVLYLIVCLFGPSKVKVERSIDIKASSIEELQHRLADLKFFHDKWSPWTRRDPGMKTIYKGVCCEPGSSYRWESEKDSVGKGTMTFNKFTPDSVLMTLNFDGMGDNELYFITKPSGNGTINVTWGVIFDIGFFGRAPMMFINMDKIIGGDYETGLAKLKQEIESMPVSATTQYEIKETNWDAKTFYGVKEKLAFDKLAAFFGQSYGKIGAALGKAKAQPIGQPKAIYFSFDEKTKVTDVAAVMEVANGTKLEGVEKFEIPAGKVLHIEYYGAYDKSANAHYAMDAYIKDKGLTQSYVLEEYVTDPMTEKDTAKWLTNIFYLVK